MAARFDIRWGDQVLDALTVSDERGRDLLELRPANGSGGRTFDSGPVLRRSTVLLTWTSRDDGDDPLARRQAFLEAVDAGETRLFVHPIEGAIAAKVGRVTGQNGAGDAQDTVEFVEDPATRFAPVEPAASVQPRAGTETVRVAAQRVELALEPIGEASLVPAESTALAESWTARVDETDEPVDARRVYRELEAATSAIDAELARLRAGQVLARYHLYLAFVALGAELARAAEAATSETASSFPITVERAGGLIALALDLGGPAKAVRLAAGMRALNRIDTPALVPAGTRLLVPVL